MTPARRKPTSGGAFRRWARATIGIARPTRSNRSRSSPASSTIRRTSWFRDSVSWPPSLIGATYRRSCLEQPRSQAGIMPDTHVPGWRHRLHRSAKQVPLSPRRRASSVAAKGTPWMRDTASIAARISQMDNIPRRLPKPESRRTDACRRRHRRRGDSGQLVVSVGNILANQPHYDPLEAFANFASCCPCKGS